MEQYIVLQYKYCYGGLKRYYNIFIEGGSYSIVCYCNILQYPDI